MPLSFLKRRRREMWAKPAYSFFPPLSLFKGVEKHGVRNGFQQILGQGGEKKKKRSQNSEVLVKLFVEEERTEEAWSGCANPFQKKKKKNTRKGEGRGKGGGGGPSKRVDDSDPRKEREDLQTSLRQP